MALKSKLFNNYLACFLSIFLPIIIFQNSFSAIYQWEDCSKFFDEKTDLMCRHMPAVIKVNLPEELKNYKSIPLVVRIETDPTRIRRRHYLIVNNYNQEKYYIKTNTSYRVEINSKHLKAGLNTLEFINSIDWCSYGSNIRELRFDFSGMEEVKAHLEGKQSPVKAAKDKPRPPAQQFQKDMTPPQIIITSHDTTRGIRPVQNLKKVTISGRATDENGIVEIKVNARDIVFDEAGNFETDVYLKVGKNRIVVSAMDIYENRGRKEFAITRAPSQKASKAKVARTEMGSYHALVIGNNNYQYLRKLETAKNDAVKVAKILKLLYGFDTKLLLDADRDAILDGINHFRKILNQDDQFLIYYAGHGSFDRIAGKAYWLPVDAQKNNDKNWIIVDTVTSNIKRISSKHVLIVADSCYSGTFTRTSALAKLESSPKRRVYLKKEL